MMLKMDAAMRSRRSESNEVANVFWRYSMCNFQMICSESRSIAASRVISAIVAAIQTATSGMHWPVHIVQGCGIAHWKTVAEITAMVQSSNRHPIVMIPTRCIVVSSSRNKNSSNEHFPMLSASTDSIFATKIFICIWSMLAESKRHFCFPSPESTAVVMMSVLARAHSAAVTTIASSLIGS